MLDRLVTAAGGLADAADRAVRLVLRGPRHATRRVSVVIAVGLVLVAGLAVVASLETPSGDADQAFGAAEIAALEDSPGRFGAVVSGGLAPQYTEYFQDLDLDGTWDEGEPTTEWDYFLLDPIRRQGVTVRSDRPIADMYRLSASGRVAEDRTGIAADRDWFWELEAQDLDLDDVRFIDARAPVGDAPAHDLGDELPAIGSPVAVDAARSVSYVSRCGPPDDLVVCPDPDADDATAFDVLAYDPERQRAVVVRTTVDPELASATIRGVVRRDAPGVASALDGTGWARDALGFTVSPRYILVDGATPPSGIPLLILAAACLVFAGLIMAGGAAGYVVFRPAERATGIAGARTLDADGRIAARVTGTLHGRGGAVHVREAPGHLVRFATALGDDAPTTLIVQRQGEPEGVTVGRGDVTDLETGSVRSLRWERPAIRLVAATGRLVMTFDDAAARDAAAAEITAEATDASAPETRTEPDPPPTHEEDRWTPGS